MKKMPATLLCDFYKLSHKNQYPEKTEKVYSTWIPRSNKHALTKTDKVIAFGFQGLIKKYLIDYFNDNFFKRKIEEVCNEYVRYVKNCLGVDSPDSSHIEDLHKLGYLPVKICAVKEGTKVPIRVPMLTIENTHKDFFWVTNYLETIMSCEMWLPSTTATIANEYKEILNKYADETCENRDVVQFQGHDFSMRGMCGKEAAQLGGAGHLLSFVGTDTIPAIGYLEKYYNADIEKELVGCSVPATEHSVMSAGGKGTEFETYKRIMFDIHPTGIVSIVSDTWDLWKVLSDIIKPLKNEIMKRDGKVVIRPDSGEPVDILCKVINILWGIFGGKVNSKGYKELNPCIGAIYGDSITLERCQQICERLKKEGFATNNFVLGIGSYTYQYNTRDTYGFVMKATYCIIDGKEINITKDPVTDDGLKKSLTGLVSVHEEIFNDGKKTRCYDGLNKEQYDLNSTFNLLKPIYEDGELLVDFSLREIKDNLSNN